MKVLKLILDPQNSLLYETTARQEVEKFLLNAKKTLQPVEVKCLKDFIHKAPKPKGDQKGLTSKDKKYLLGLIEGKEEPRADKLYVVESGFVGPLMDEDAFANLSNQEITDHLANRQEFYTASPKFTDVTQDWKSFVPYYSQRAWEILQDSRILNDDQIWEDVAWGLVLPRQTENKRDLSIIYKEQWDVFSITGGFFDKYIERDLEPSPLIDWLNRVASKLKLADDEYLTCWSKLWKVSKSKQIFYGKVYSGKEEKQSDYLTTAINDSRGKLAEGLIDALFRHQPQHDSKIPLALKRKFTLLFKTDTEAGWLAQLIFARQLRNLYVIDSGWTQQYLIPAFDYSQNQDRSARIWTGFLYNPNLHFDTLEAIKIWLLGLIDKWEVLFPNPMCHLKDMRKNLIWLITSYKLNYPETFTDREFKVFFQKLKLEDLGELFSLFFQLLAEPVQKGKDAIFWEETLKPFFNMYWPGEQRSGNISRGFLKLAIRCPNALISIRDYLIMKPFLSKADFSHSTIIYSLSKEDDPNEQAPFISLDHAKAFFDLLERILEPNLGQEQRWGLYGSENLLIKFSSRFPEIRKYSNFIKVQQIFGKL